MRNAKKVWIGIIVGLSLVIGGCYKMYFHPDPASSTAVQHEKFHHVGIYDLVEFSEPLDLKRECETRGWKTFKAHKSFLAGLVGSFTQPLYGPWNKGWSCQ